MSLYKAEKPMNLKVCVGPAKMIVSTANAMKPFALTQNTAKTSPYPFVDHWKGGFVTVFEVFKPSSQGLLFFLGHVSRFISSGSTAASP